MTNNNDSVPSDVTLDSQEGAEKLENYVPVVSIANAPESIKTATKSGKVKRAKKQAEEKKEPEPFVVFQADSEVDSVALSDLVALDSVPVHNGAYAMREINMQHVDHMVEALEAGDQLPAIEIVNTNYGHVPFDGYHRWAAYEKYLRNLVSEVDANGNLVVDSSVLAEARKQLFIPAHENTINSERELMQRAFSANLAHGLPASDQSRSRFALWLHAEAQADGAPISIREAARQARVSHVAVLKAKAKLDSAKKKMVDIVLSSDEQEELDNLSPVPVGEEQKALEAAEKHMQNILKAVKFFSTQQISSTEMERFASSYAESTTKEAIASLQNEVISFLSYVYHSAPYAPSPEQQELLKA